MFDKARQFSALAKYAGLTTDQLTREVVQDIATKLGFEVVVDDTKFGEVVNLLKANNVDGLADLIANNDVAEKVKSLLQPVAAQDDHMIICPHCGEYINPQV